MGIFDVNTIAGAFHVENPVHGCGLRRIGLGQSNGGDQYPIGSTSGGLSRRGSAQGSVPAIIRTRLYPFGFSTQAAVSWSDSAAAFPGEATGGEDLARGDGRAAMRGGGSGLAEARRPPWKKAEKRL